MPKLSTRTIVWILTFLLSDVVTEKPNAAILEKDSFFDPLEKRLTYDPLGNFWRRRLLYKNDSIERIGLKYSNKISQIGSSQQAKNTDIEKQHKSTMENISKGTLADYNNPAILKDLDNENDQESINHIRVKRNVPRNNSIVCYQRNHSVNLLDSDQNFWDKNRADSALGESMSKYEGYYVDSNCKNKFGIMNETMRIYSRHKRGVLSKNGRRRKRVKGNIAKHRIKIKIGSKKQSDTLKSSHKPSMGKINSLGKRNKKRKFTRMIDTPQMRSRIEKRESINKNLDTGIIKSNSIGYEKANSLVDKKKYISLTNNKSPEEQPNGNNVALPFVHTGRAELRVRIEEAPTNKSTFINPNVSPWIGRSSTTDSFSTTLPRYEMVGKIINTNITNSKSTQNFDSTGRKEASNSTVEIILKIDYGNNTSTREANDSESRLFYNAAARPIESALSEDQVDRNADNERNYVNKISAESAEEEDAKSRAKRNQERSKDARGRTSVRGATRERKRYRRTHRVGRPIEEIKELVEKLVAKVNELQIYVSNASRKSSRTRHSCVDGKADYKDVEEAPRSISSEYASSTSKIAGNIDEHHERLAKSTSRQVTGERAFRVPSFTRFARGYRNGERKSRRKWGRWTDWSSCSVTCGKGRQIRWRQCLHDCDDAETEMEEKACQLPACPPGKFLGIF